MRKQVIQFVRRWELCLLVGIVYVGRGASVHVNHTCSSRSDGQCTRCDGIPQCFDLSDEMNCLQHSINLIPVSEVVDKCTGKRCIGGFPEPPPLPPFSLCDHVDITTKPTTTQTTRPATTPTTGPTNTPTTEPTTGPTDIPTIGPTTKPLTKPTTEPSTSPSTIQVTSVSTSIATSQPCSTPAHVPTTPPSTPNWVTPAPQPTTTPRYTPICNQVMWECFSLCNRSADIRFCLAIVNLCQQCLKIYAKNQRQSDSYYQTVPWRQSVRATTTPLAPRESVVYHTKPAVISSNSNQRWPFSRQGSIPVAHNSQPHSRPTFTNSHSVRTDNTGILPQPSLWHATKMTWYNPTTLSPFHAPQAIVPAQNHLLDLFRLEILQEAF